MADYRPQIPPQNTPVLTVDNRGMLTNTFSRDWYKFLLDARDTILITANQPPDVVVASQDGELLNESLALAAALQIQEQISSDGRSEPPFISSEFGFSEPIEASYPESSNSADAFGVLEERIDLLEAASSAPPKTLEDLTDIIFESGTYTPTPVNDTNVDSSVGRKAIWMRIGNTVSASGQIDVKATAGATLTILGLTLPIPSAFTTVYQLGGTANAITVAGQSAGIQADVANGRASITWISGSTNNETMTYMLQYEVL